MMTTMFAGVMVPPLPMVVAYMKGGFWSKTHKKIMHFPAICMPVVLESDPHCGFNFCVVGV